MIATRAPRLLLLSLAAVGISWLAFPGHAPVQANESAGFVTIQFDSAWVRPPSFSPNGDSRRDSVEVAFTLPESMEVFVYVTPAGAPDTIRVIIAQEDLAPLVVHRREWNGFDAAGFRQPEGKYTMHFHGTAQSGQQYVNQRQFEIDLTAPAPQILQVEPRRYTPTIPGQEAQVPEIRVRFTMSELDDQVGVNVLDSLGIRLGTLAPAAGFGGDGVYIFLCDTCADPTVRDGVLLLEAFGMDAAANDSTVVDSLDKNIAGPIVQLTHPQILSRQRADSLVGLAEDRQIVDSLWVSLAAPPQDDFVFVPRRNGVPGSTYPFLLDLSDVLVNEGEYPIRFKARDVEGVSRETPFTLRIDRTPPASPRPDPPLPEVVRSSMLGGTVALDGSEADVLVVSGGVGDPDSIEVQGRDLVLFTRTLATGPNVLRFEAIDLAGNVSAPTTVDIRYDLSAGLFAPERFRAGDRIELVMGDTPAQGVVVRVLAMDGSLVRVFQDTSARRQYAFPWDLQTPEGRPVRNGAYLVVAQVRRSGSEERLRTMIAVVR